MKAIDAAEADPAVPEHRGERHVADRADEARHRRPAARRGVPRASPAAGDRRGRSPARRTSGTHAASAPAISRPIAMSRPDGRPIHHEVVAGRGEARSATRMRDRRSLRRLTCPWRRGPPSPGDALGRPAPRASSTSRGCAGQPEDQGEEDDHDGPPTNSASGELPADQDRQDDAELDDEVGRRELEGHRGGEVGALAEDRSRQGDRRVGARRRRRAEPGTRRPACGASRRAAAGVISRLRHDRLHQRR